MFLDADIRKWLKDRLADRVRFNEPMAGHTSFRVGGAAEALVTPGSPGELIAILDECGERKTPCTIIGRGTNLLVRDAGVPGVVLMTTRGLDAISRTETDDGAVVVTAGAGAGLKTLCAYALGRGLAGLNFAIGIPGAVGGSVAMNAGSGPGAMGEILDSVEILAPLGPNGRFEARTLAREELEASYRKLAWKDPPDHVAPDEVVITRAHFRLAPGDPAGLRKEAARIMRNRMASQPLGAATAGCVFKNPPEGRPAGELIERAGLKGRRVGGARVSPLHANFIINTGGASAGDILELMKIVRDEVNRIFHVTLEREVKIIGSKKIRQNRRNRKSRGARARERTIRWLTLGGKAAGVICATAVLSLLFILVHDVLVQCRYFNATVVSVTGCRRLSETAIMNQAGVTPGVNILSVNLTAARKRLLAHPWIAEAEVRRDIPDAIHIRVREHVPLASLDLGKEFLINREGAIFKTAAAGENEGLPLITGLTFADIAPPGSDAGKPFQAVLDVLNLGAREGVVLPNQLVREIRVDREIGLTLMAFDQGRAIKLGYGAYPQKYARLRNVLFYMKQRQEFIDFVSIDLNDLERVVVSPAGQEDRV